MSLFKKLHTFLHYQTMNGIQTSKSTGFTQNMGAVSVRATLPDHFL